MNSVINAYNAATMLKTDIADRMNIKEVYLTRFKMIIRALDMFVVKDIPAIIEMESMFEKLYYHNQMIDEDDELDWKELTCSKDMIDKDPFDTNDVFDCYRILMLSKQKKHVGDSFKWIVTDNWKVDMVITFNLRSLKNYLTLRDSGAAYFLMRELAKAIKAATPLKYLRLIDKEFKDKSMSHV
jgi:thymidylate synthase (FAD)